MRLLAILALLTLLTGCRETKHPAVHVSDIVMNSASPENRLIRGFSKSNGEWRWTAPVFTVSLDSPADQETVHFELDYTVPGEVNPKAHPVTLTVKANGMPVGQVTHPEIGRFLFSRPVPSQALQKLPVQIECTVDRSFATDSGETRSLIVVSAKLVAVAETASYREKEMLVTVDEFRKLFQRRGLPLAPEREYEFLKIFHQLPIETNTWFHTVRVIKNPIDLWVMQQIVHQVRPDFIIETGTWRGGSALFWAGVLASSGLENSRVLTVDIQDARQAAAHDPLWNKYVQFYLGSSTDPALVSNLARQSAGKKVLVSLDSDHSRRHVLREMRMYSPLVSRGSYLIVEDTHLDGVPTHPEEGPGPFAAVLQFMRDGGAAQFEQDLSRESSGTSWNAGGWLRKR